MEEKIKKSPAFLFYVQDFLVGTMGMTATEIGGYILLLCYQWDNGFIPSDDKKIEKISKISSKKIKNVLIKFSKKGDKYINERLEEERHKRLKFIEKQIENGSKGGRPKKPKPKPKINPDESLSFSFSNTTINNNSSKASPHFLKVDGIAMQLMQQRSGLDIEQAKDEARKLLIKNSNAGTTYIAEWASRIKLKTKFAIMLTPFGQETEWTMQQYHAQKDNTTYKFLRYEDRLVS